MTRLVPRLVPWLICLLGLFVLLYAVAMGCGAALPYPDPTPELLIHQRDDIHAAKVLALVGAGLLVVGATWLGWRWRSRLRSGSMAPWAEYRRTDG